MFICWDSNIMHLDQSKSWHMEFSDFNNDGNFELKLFVPGFGEEEYTLLQEDGSDFNQRTESRYPYFLFDYAVEVMQAIQNSIEKAEVNVINLILISD